MIRRCTNPRRKSYKDYGGRGIYVCDEWIQNHNSFVQWALENGWVPGASIDRIDNDGPYAPDNCRFVLDPKTQQNNKTTSVVFTVDGITATVAQWAILINKPTPALYHLRYESNDDLMWFLTTRWERLSPDEKQSALKKIEPK